MNTSDMTLNVWEDAMDGSAQVGTFTETFTGTYTDIQYMSFSNQHGGNSVRGLSFNVDNLKFCDGVTSMSSCPMQGEIGTVLSFETKEADTMSSTQTVTQSQGSTGGWEYVFNTGESNSNANWSIDFMGQKFPAGHTLVGAVINQIQCDLSYNGNPNEVLKLVKLDSSNVVTVLEDIPF